jgi:predicted ATP-dependent serine protease
MNNFCMFCDQIKPSHQGMCNECRDEYNLIRDYIMQRTDANAMDISNSTKVSLMKIRRFIEKGNLLSN